MSYSNGLLSETSNFQGGRDGKDGLPGVGFKLTPAGDLDLQNKKMTNVAEGTVNSDAITKHQVDTLATQLRADSLQVDGSSHMTGDLDLRGQKLVNPGEIEMNRKLIVNLATDDNQDLSAVNMITLKKFHPDAPAHTHEVTKDIDLKEPFNVKNSKQQTYHDLGANYNNLISYNDGRNIFLSREETFPMKTALDMGNHTIFNVKDPEVADQGANMRYVDAQSAKKLSLEGGTMTGNLDMNSQQINNIATPTLKHQPTSKSYVDNKIGGVVVHTIELKEKVRKYVNESHITSTSHPKDAFRYLIENVDESSSEHNMTVTEITDFSNSPHHFNKKAYDLQITKDHFNEYDGRLGFNMFKLPEGEYTMCIEFFPASMDGVSVNVVTTSLNINQQSTQKFSGYSRSIIHMHKWKITPPEFIYLDLKWRGTAESAEKGNANLIIYGVAGSQPDVESSVYDFPFVFEGGAMVMETDLDLNGNAVLNLPLRPSKHFIFARFEKGKHNDCLIFPNEEEDETNYWQQFGSDFRILDVTVFILQRGPNPVSGSTIIMTSVVQGDRIIRNAVRPSTNSFGSLQFTFNQNVGKEEAFFLALSDGNTIQRAKVAILIEK